MEFQLCGAFLRQIAIGLSIDTVFVLSRGAVPYVRQGFAIWISLFEDTHTGSDSGRSNLAVSTFS